MSNLVIKSKGWQVCAGMTLGSEKKAFVHLGEPLIYIWKHIPSTAIECPPNLCPTPLPSPHILSLP